MPGHVKKSTGPDPDPTEFLFVSLEQKRQDQTKPYDAKKSCWVPDEKEGFVEGEIQGTKGDLVTVMAKGDTKTLKKDLVQQVNPPKFEKCEDMSNLTYLNDASVLYNLKARYVCRLIYTYSGLFCVVINPYKRYPIYTNRVVKIYQGKRRNEVPPHLFAISDGAYSNMLQGGENQSMLITGESGAGKTENTKKVLSYFANVGATTKKKDEATKPNLEDQIVQTNPILEAFGNAKTVRNDNSSRFGKFIRIHFGNSGKLSGGDIEVYLLEKARVISQQPLERSYHIFYEMMSDQIDYLKKMCCLSNDIYDYHYVSQGKVTVPSIDDKEDMQFCDEAFDILGFSMTDKENVYKLTAAVMHFGELKFKQRGREEQAEPDGTEAGEKVATMMGMDGADLYHNITKPKIKVGAEFVAKGMNVDQCYYSVGAMAKAVYDRVFRWLVTKCNETLATGLKRVYFIGVLDIAGFEIFEFNGFEQICINFCNEKLQQFFNHHMFVLEQEEYKREGINWVFVDFGMDLQACIDLFEKKMGLLSILEEESMFPKATDKSFLEKLNANHLGKTPVFIKPKPIKGGPEAHFAIVHYAGTVNYNLAGWLEKNKDPLNDTLVDQIKKASNELAVTIFADHPGQSGTDDKKGGRGQKSGAFKTVSSGYREQLNNLMRTLNATHPHFIRCIVPNETKSPGVIDAALVMHQLTCNGVLEGIRICRKGFPNRIPYKDFRHRYKILAPREMEKATEDKECATVCLSKAGLNEELYRCGNTKVFFRAGALGTLEEIRDDTLAKLMTFMQAWIRGYISRKSFEKLQEQRVALIVVQRNLRKFLKMRTWKWFNLWQRVKPLLNVTRIEDEIKALEEKAAKAEEELEKETKLRKELQAAMTKLQEEKNNLLTTLESTKGNVSDFLDKQAKLQSQKADLEAQLNELTSRLQSEEDARNQLFQGKKKSEQEMNSLKKDVEDLELVVQRNEQERATKDHQIHNLNEEVAHQEELINKLMKEKKHLQECNQKTAEDLQSVEDKCNHLSKVKAKLEQTLDELEDSLEREKKMRFEMEKNKRKGEGDLRLTQEAVADLERNTKELEQTIQRKDKEISSLAGKLEEEQILVSRTQKQIKELQARIEELEQEVEHERQSRAKAEKSKAILTKELGELSDRLEEAGGATAAQIELNKKREAELAKLRRDLEETNIQQEAALANLRKKHNDAIGEMSDQIDHLNKMKARAEKDKEAMKREADDAKASMDALSRDKANAEKTVKQQQQVLNEYQNKMDEANRTLNDMDAAKKKLTAENTDLLRQVEEVESQINQLSKIKLSLTNQLEDQRKLADDESRERATLLGKYRNLEHDIDGLREQLEEESESKTDAQRQLAKASADAQMWRSKYETEGIARVEELEAARLKLAARLEEAEDQIEQLNVKNLNLEKTKQRIATELEDMQIEVERAQALANAAEKKQKNFDRIISEWKMKVDDLAAELDASQKECRNYASEHFRIKAAYEENLEQLDAVRRENKNLSDEIKDLMDQIGEGGRTLHEVQKNAKRLEVEKEELQAALEEAEAALEQEENKVLRAQLELSQVRQEIDRRIQEKEEEFENTRKCHQRAIDSMQASLEAEAKAKAEALRLKKKLESDINELEIALDHSNKANADLQKQIKKQIGDIKDLQIRAEVCDGAAMAVDNRSTSALFKRAEQIRRWQESDTNKQEISDNHRTRKVNFTDGCIFLAACAAGDKQEVIRLLEKGADIDTANVDGLTALHAACIDDNLDMVEFLVDQGTDVNRGDMEGWTPLHATASCGFNSIAKFLIDRGADLSLVNNDGDLAIDIADSDEMEMLLQQEIESRGIDCEASRNREERRMLEDAQHWLQSGYLADRPHSKTGATALHVASAKGYIKVMSLLIEAGADINAKDNDGWTPLHAAAHWGQREAIEILCENMADMEVRNFVGQSAFDVADNSLLRLMDELKKKQAALKLVNQNKQVPRKRKTSPHREHSNKKEREDSRESDEKRNKVNKENATPQIIPTSVLSNKNRTQSEARSENAFDESEVQSWRRPSSFRKNNQEDKNQKEEASRTSSTTTITTTTATTTTTTTTASTPTPSARISGRDAEEERKRSAGAEKEERNHMDSMEPHVSSGSVLTTNTSPTTRSKGRSFMPPSRDEESETQRKAHAKMVRSTRRSTQGVTLEDLKSAEQLMKNKQQQQQATSSSPESKETSSTTTATTTTATTTTTTSPTSPNKPKPDSPTKADDEERRPSWRLKVDDTDKNRFSLENVRSKDKPEAENDADTPTFTVQLRKKNTEEKDEEKESERNSQTREGTQAAIQRRKKPKRRSTGKVQVNMDVSVAEDGITLARCVLDNQSVSEKGDAARGSTTSLGSALSSRAASRSSSVGPENGDIDYKKLYEEQLAETHRVNERLRLTENELRQSRESIDLNTKKFNTRLAIAESEKREKRSLERKLSEMEEELKQLQKLKAENEKLKAENRALTRVVSKLTNSATSGMGSLATLSK